MNPKSRLTDGRFSRLAVFIHEPHSSVFGQFDMMDGLTQLLAANPNHRFMFLVEGDYEGSDRTIRLEPWKGIIDEHANPEALMAWLVENYVVDGALAFRLLRPDDDVPSFAIDSQELLAATPKQPSWKQLTQAIDNLPIGDKEKKLVKMLMLFPSGKRKPEEYKAVLEVCDQLKRALPKHQAVFRQLRNHIESYRVAAERDAVMVDQIVRRMKEQSDRIPVVFIGNFHTDGILELLGKRQPNLACLVLDIRGFFLGAGDMEQFQQRIHDPASYLRRLKTRKGPVAPRRQDVPVLKEKLEQKQAALDLFRERIKASSPLGNTQTRDLVAQLQRSVVSQKAIIEFPGEPPKNREFASYTPGESGRPGRLIVYARDSAGWREAEARSQVIAMALRSPPAFNAVRRVDRHTIGERSFSVLYDGSGGARKVYFFEGAPAGPMLEVLLPVKDEAKRDSDHRLHQVAENERATNSAIAA